MYRLEFIAYQLRSQGSEGQGWQKSEHLRQRGADAHGVSYMLGALSANVVTYQINLHGEQVHTCQ